MLLVYEVPWVLVYEVLYQSHYLLCSLLKPVT